MSEQHVPQPKAVLITGGAGFIGTNLALSLLRSGEDVIILDDLSRAGAQDNLRFLRAQYGDRVKAQVTSINDRKALRSSLQSCSAVFHFAAQVAVTRSLENPLHDFEVNAGGTLALLEELRALPERPPMVFTSTNKVYGALEDVSLHCNEQQYVPDAPQTAKYGISENRALEFHSPYGCSKGAADQYVLDYARTFGLPACVFRMSCIYGPHQHGTEDQGWLAHFLIRALQGEVLTIYGDGKQVRDVLFVEDLVRAFLLARRHMQRVAGRAFNIGGGPNRTLSLLGLVQLMGSRYGLRPQISFDEWLQSDQRYYVSDCRAFEAASGWMAAVSVEDGVDQLFQFLCSRQLPQSTSTAAFMHAAVGG